eukprot:TRINITY_DN25826_c0_g1_i1.p1 TRINITY_DN25826_c0_g1~~TRINITY_DN25826_c0_g1_i1.p1  ORF type:complete len:738 (+),score=129.92 TRINITY_DN25826_c0_g1_i1:288-2501(+)
MTLNAAPSQPLFFSFGRNCLAADDRHQAGARPRFRSCARVNLNFSVALCMACARKVFPNKFPLVPAIKACAGSHAKHLLVSRAAARAGGTSVSEPMPSYEKYSDDLILVIRQAEAEARQRGQVQLGTDALLLGLLTIPGSAAPCAEATRAAAFPNIDVSTMLPFVSQSSDRKKDSSSSSGPPLTFTPMTRRALSAAEDEQQRLSHEVVEPAHLLLSLLKDERGEACSLLDRFGQEKEHVRRRILQTLSGPLARIRLQAANELLRFRSEESAAPPDSFEGVEAALMQKLQKSLTLITEGLVERSVEAKLLLLAALGGEHLFLLGPPGTAKSLLARRLALVCQGRPFERLLTRFSVPEEIFGPLSLKALENDELRRKVEGFLPDAEVAFLDEVFKANSSILNALLAILNEGIFDNGGYRMQVPLWCAVAASNELPESEELDALFDRFLLRRAVPRISDQQVVPFLRGSLEFAARAAEAGDLENISAVLSEVDSHAAQAEAAEKIVFPDELLMVVVNLRSHLRDEAEPPVQLSDRRLGKAVRMIRLGAYAAGGNEVCEIDLLLLQHMCWDRDPEKGEHVRKWLLDQLGTNIERGFGEKDVVEQARYLLSGVRARLRRTPRKKDTISTAERDLAAIRVPLEDQLRERLARQDRLAKMFSGDAARFFWVEPADVAEAKQIWLPAAKEACMQAEEMLKDALELQFALRVSEREAMDACLQSLLLDFREEQEAPPRVTISATDL